MLWKLSFKILVANSDGHACRFKHYTFVTVFDAKKTSHPWIWQDRELLFWFFFLVPIHIIFIIPFLLLFCLCKVRKCPFMKLVCCDNPNFYWLTKFSNDLWHKNFIVPILVDYINQFHDFEIPQLHQVDFYLDSMAMP